MISRLKPHHWLLLALLCILALRLVSLPMYPLMDTTEARYAEMSRKMLETGNWLTPMFDYGVPFWGKPPLAFWAGAATMSVFGVNEFGARLAPFLASIIAGLLFFAWPFQENRRVKALICFIVMQTTVIGFIGAGAVMTDEYLLLATNLCMVAFWRAVQPGNRHKIWGYLFFIGLALGLLAKGPLIFVLVGFPALAWVLLRRQWRAVWHNLPWVGGVVIMLVLAAPWYWAAEKATPGFLQYFIVGEHFQRFLVKGWQGDLYGRGHGRMLGMIWWYGIICTLPWLLLWPYAFWRRLFNRDLHENLYLILWMLTPLCFFTLARNVLPAYVLPGLGAFAVLTTHLLSTWQKKRPVVLRYISVVVVVGIAILVFVIGFTPVNTLMQNKSQKNLLRAWDGKSELIYIDKRPYSGQFYSGGRAALMEFTDEGGKTTLLTSDKSLTVIIRKKDYERYAASFGQWNLAVDYAKGRWYMLTNFSESPKETVLP